MAKAHIHQIFTDEASRDAIDPAFIPLDHTSRERADWQEYWPIRKALHAASLQPGELHPGELHPGAHYGFLTSRFKPEADVAAAEMAAFVGLVGDGYDVINFTPFPDQHALFWNVFEHGEYQLPGHAALCQQVIAALELKADVTELVMDSRNSIFRTYFTAKPAFWEKWLALADKLVALADVDGPLRGPLNATLPVRADLPGLLTGQAKVAVMERIAPLVLALDPELKAVSFNPFQRPRTRSPFAEFPFEAVLSDALKIAYSVRGDPLYKSAFGEVRAQVQKAMQAKAGG